MFIKDVINVVCLLCVVCVFIGLSLSCSSPFGNEDEGIDDVVLTDEEVTEIRETCNSAIEILSESLAYSITADEQILSIVHEELGKRFDGDTEVLLETVFNRMVDNGTTVRDVVSGSCATALARRSDKDAVYSGDVIDYIVTNLEQIINLQIYMPNYDEWDGVTVPLVSFIPFTYDVEEEGYFNAYDSEGNEYTIDTENLYDQPIFIIGPNERTDSEGNVYEDLVALSDESDKTVINGRSTLGRDVPEGREGAEEVLEYFEIWNKHEGPGRGDAEIRIQFKNNGFTKTLAYNGIREHDRQFVKARLFYWQKEAHGMSTYYKVYESDGGDSGGSKRLASNTSKNDFRADTPAPEPPLIPDLPASLQNLGKWMGIITGSVNFIKLILGIGSGPDLLNEGYILYTDEPKEYKKDGECVIMMNYYIDPIPPAYTLTVHSFSDQGVESVVSYTDCTESGSVSISTSPTAKIEDHIPEPFEFYMWQFTSGSADIDDPYSPSATVSNFTEDVTIKANYIPSGSGPAHYTLTVDYRDSGGTSRTRTWDVTHDSSVSIETVQTYSSGSTPYTFSNWKIDSGSATLANRNSRTTTVTNITADTRINAQYDSDTPTPTYTLTVYSSDADGPRQPVRITCEEDDETPISTAASYTTAGVTMDFVRWNLSGDAGIVNPGNPSTTVTNVKRNTTVTAQYTERIYYTLTVTYLDSNGASHSEQHTVTNKSVVSICTADYITVHAGIRIYFIQWHSSPTAVISSPTSSCTTITYFTGDTTVSAAY